MSIEHKSIVVLEDDPLTLTIYEKLLNQVNCEYFLYQEFRDFLNHLKTNPTDLIILDIDIGNEFFNGLDIIKMTGKSNRKYDFPIIVISADCSNGTINSAIDGGAIDYLIKPVGFPTFIEKITDLLNKTSKKEIKKYEESTLAGNYVFKELFGDNPNVCVEVGVNVKAINEISFVAESDILLSPNVPLKFVSEFFDSIKVSIPYVFASNSVYLESDQRYATLFNFVAIDENSSSELRRIRGPERYLWTIVK